MTLEEQCEMGQRQLMETRYLEAIETFVAAESVAWQEKDYESISRLYMPLQEARRQVRQRCGEGIVNLGVIAQGPGHLLDIQSIVEHCPGGQLLVAGWGTIEPAVKLRKLALEKRLYLEIFLAGVFPIVGGSRAVVVVPLEGVRLPDPQARSIDELIKLLPAHSLVYPAGELVDNPMRGNTETFARVSALWEQLHQPFLAAADAQGDLLRKIDGFHMTIQVDSACELAHQNLSAAAKKLAKGLVV